MERGQGKPESPKGRLASLDVLRGVAILLVLGRHHPLDPYKNGIWTWPGIGWLRYGWTGVDLFFVLSGFLVGGLLMREVRDTGGLRIKRFLYRRGFRIWPGYYVYLAVLTAILYGETTSGDFSRVLSERLLPCFLNYQNYAYDVIPRFHLWSLAVEEHFYLVIPLLITAALRWGSRRQPLQFLPGVVAGIAIAAMALRAQASFTGKDTLFITFATHLRLDSLAWGVLLAYLYHVRRDVWAKWAARPRLLLVASLVLVGIGGGVKSGAHFTHVVGFAFLYVGYGALLMAMVTAGGETRRAAAVRSWPGRFIAWVGFNSYSIYLWHEDAGVRLGRVFDSRWMGWHLPGWLHWPAVTVVYVASAIGAGWLMARIVEHPVMGLRDRYFPASRAAAGVAADPALVK